MTRTLATYLALWLLIATAVAVGVLVGSLLAGTVAAQSSGQGDPALGGTGAAVAPRLLGERRATDDASSGHGSGWGPLRRGGGVQRRAGDEPAGRTSTSRAVNPDAVSAPIPSQPDGSAVVDNRVRPLRPELSPLAFVPSVMDPTLLLRLSGLSVTHLSSGCHPASRAAPESIPAVSRPVAGSVTLDDLAQRGQPDDHPGAQPAALGRITPSPSPTRTRPEVTTKPRTATSLRGTATWFRSPSGVSAAGPDLRSALGPDWRGTRVRVSGPAGSILVELGDWMRADRLVDLDDGQFVRVCGPLWRGVCRVTVTP